MSPTRIASAWVLLQIAAMTAVAQSPSFEPNDRWIDLTHPFDEATIYWPTEDGFKLSTQEFGVTDKGYFYASKRFAAAEHGGTHLDAPLHFSRQGMSVDQLPLDRLIGKVALEIHRFQ